jgi:hypothetical protein
MLQGWSTTNDFDIHMTEERESAKKREHQGAKIGCSGEATVAALIVTSAVALVSVAVAVTSTPVIGLSAAAVAVGTGVTAALTIYRLIFGD